MKIRIISLSILFAGIGFGAYRAYEARLVTVQYAEQSFEGPTFSVRYPESWEKVDDRGAKEVPIFELRGVDPVAGRMDIAIHDDGKISLDDAITKERHFESSSTYAEPVKIGELAGFEWENEEPIGSVDPIGTIVTRVFFGRAPNGRTYAVLSRLGRSRRQRLRTDVIVHRILSSMSFKAGNIADPVRLRTH